ncbi:unnamed protein product [Blepharisma stoltei]|uniref:Uncharacterized protein n=1 Tax=Blepharisma stoltei TaxID=1481888 RepID=A0AAU9IPK7_9CILI|nr:unnamed protein product [Blepharisma stoltei]
MDQYLCTFSSCKNRAKYSCDCNSAPFCKNHVSEHKKLPKKPHSIEPLFTLPNPETKNTLLIETNYVLEQLRNNNKKLIEYVSRIFAAFENILEKSIIDAEHNINKILTNITNTTKLCKLEKDRYLQCLNLDPLDALDIFRWFIEHDLEVRASEIKNAMEEIMAIAEELSNYLCENINTFWDSSRQTLLSKDKKTLLSEGKQSKEEFSGYSKPSQKSQDPSLSNIIDEAINLIELEEQSGKLPEKLQNKPQIPGTLSKVAQCWVCSQWKASDEYTIKCQGHDVCNRCRIKNLEYCLICKIFYSDHENIIKYGHSP